MKARNIILILLWGALLLPLCFTSCGVDRWKGYAEQTATDRWIDDTMRVWYYWSADIPHTDKLNYFQKPETFFKSLLSREDRFSVIDSLKSYSTATRSIPDTDYSYGFQFALGQLKGSYYAHVLYVVPGSPAAEIGLVRGDWIMAINGEPVSRDNATLLYGGGAVELTVGYFDRESQTIVAYEAARPMAAARVVDDNPVYYYNIFTPAGLDHVRVGYLVYNHFTYGATTQSEEYDDALRRAFSHFAAGQVNEFVLDLRYNNGGYVSCAQLLATMLAPASRLGQPMASMVYGTEVDAPVAGFDFDAALIGNGANLDLKRLYVLTSPQTASASELVINSLKPYMDVVLVGATTVGKNVGSIEFSNPEQRIVMHPIVCKIFNAEGESDYQQGFPADYRVNENDDVTTFRQFGDPDEAMLSKALALIAESYGAADADDVGGEEAPATRMALQPMENSLDRRASGAVRVR